MRGVLFTDYSWEKVPSMKNIKVLHCSGTYVSRGLGFVSSLKYILGLGCHSEDTWLFINLPPLSSALCSQVDVIAGDGRWLRDLNSFFVPRGLSYKEWGKLQGGNKNCWQQKEKRSCFQCRWHIFISSYILGSYKILSFHLEQLLAGSLCNRFMALKLEWNISKLLVCLTVKLKVEDDSQHGSCISFTDKL